MIPERIEVDIASLEDLAAQARGQETFGVRIGDRALSFSVLPKETGVAIMFVVIGVMEGLRSAGRESALIIPDRKGVLVADLTGEISLRAEVEGEEHTLARFETWPDALAAIHRVLAVA